MTDVNGDSNTNLNADGTPAGSVTPPAAPPADEMVSKKELDAVIKESIKRKQELADTKKALDDEKKRIEAMKNQGFKDKEMWKELAEANEQKAKEFESKYSGLQSAVAINAKFSALKDELFKLGVLPEAINDIGQEFIDMCDIETTSTGRYTVLNAKQVAETVKLKKPYLFGRPGAPNVNTNTPGVNSNGSTTVNVSKVLELQKKYEKTKSEEDRLAYHSAMKTLAQGNPRH